MRETAKARTSEGGNDSAGAFLLVVGRDAYATYDLPASGALTIGRGESNAVRVDDPLASRAHACLHVGEAMYLEDVGSVNGTRVKDRTVKPGEQVRITIGETIQIGSTVLIVQRRAAQADLIRPETLRDEGVPITLAAPSAPRAGEAMRRVHELAERSAAGTINSRDQCRSASSGMNSINRMMTPRSRANSAKDSTSSSLNPRTKTALIFAGPSTDRCAASIPDITDENVLVRVIFSNFSGINESRLMLIRFKPAATSDSQRSASMWPFVVIDRSGKPTLDRSATNSSTPGRTNGSPPVTRTLRIPSL